MNRLADDQFPRFTIDGNAHFPNGFVLPVPSLIATSMMSDALSDAYLLQQADLFRNMGPFKQK